MDFIRINCLMAVLTEAMIHQIKTSFSLLLSFHQSPYGLILIKSKIAPQQNSEKSLFGLTFYSLRRRKMDLQIKNRFTEKYIKMFVRSEYF